MLIYFGVFVKDFFVVLFFIVGIARDRPPRYGNGDVRGGQAPALRLKKRLPFHVGRGPVPRHRSCTRPLPLCRSGSPDLDLFVIGRSQTTEGGPMRPPLKGINL